jgi:hypothetical protein
MGSMWPQSSLTHFLMRSMWPQSSLTHFLMGSMWPQFSLTHFFNGVYVTPVLLHSFLMGSMWPQFSLTHFLMGSMWPQSSLTHFLMGSMWPQSSLTHFLLQTVTNTDITFHVFFRKPILTMSHTFASFCVFPFIFIYVYFRLGSNGPHSTVKWTPQYLPCDIIFFFCAVLCRAERNIT